MCFGAVVVRGVRARDAGPWRVVHFAPCRVPTQVCNVECVDCHQRVWLQQRTAAIADGLAQSPPSSPPSTPPAGPTPDFEYDQNADAVPLHVLLHPRCQVCNKRMLKPWHLRGHMQNSHGWDVDSHKRMGMD